MLFFSNQKSKNFVRAVMSLVFLYAAYSSYGLFRAHFFSRPVTVAEAGQVLTEFAPINEEKLDLAPPTILFVDGRVVETSSGLIPVGNWLVKFKKKTLTERKAMASRSERPAKRQSLKNRAGLGISGFILSAVFEVLVDGLVEGMKLDFNQCGYHFGSNGHFRGLTLWSGDKIFGQVKAYDGLLKHPKARTIKQPPWLWGQGEG